MRKEYLDQPTKGVWIRPTRPWKQHKPEHTTLSQMTRQGNAAFPTSPNIRKTNKAAEKCE